MGFKEELKRAFWGPSQPKGAEQPVMGYVQMLPPASPKPPTLTEQLRGQLALYPKAFLKALQVSVVGTLGGIPRKREKLLEQMGQDYFRWEQEAQRVARRLREANQPSHLQRLGASVFEGTQRFRQAVNVRENDPSSLTSEERAIAQEYVRKHQQNPRQAEQWLRRELAQRQTAFLRNIGSLLVDRQAHSLLTPLLQREVPLFSLSPKHSWLAAILGVPVERLEQLMLRSTRGVIRADGSMVVELGAGVETITPRIAHEAPIDVDTDVLDAVEPTLPEKRTGRQGEFGRLIRLFPLLGRDMPHLGVARISSALKSQGASEVALATLDVDHLRILITAGQRARQEIAQAHQELGQRINQISAQYPGLTFEQAVKRMAQEGVSNLPRQSAIREVAEKILKGMPPEQSPAYTRGSNQTKQGQEIIDVTQFVDEKILDHLASFSNQARAAFKEHLVQKHGPELGDQLFRAALQESMRRKAQRKAR